MSRSELPERRSGPASDGERIAQDDRPYRDESPILQTTTLLLLPVIAVVAIAVMLQGHNKPGGGFIGGLVLAAAVALQAMAFGVPAARRLLRADPVSYVIAGLCVATASALMPILTGGVFFEGIWVSLALPGLGEIKLGTPLLFDVGVFLLVVGAGSLMVLQLMEEAEQEERAR